MSEQLKKERGESPPPPLHTCHLLYHLAYTLQGLLALLRNCSVGLENMVHLFPYL
jgi:hypothetical protein